MGKKISIGKSIDAQVWQWTETTDSEDIVENHIRNSYRLKLPQCKNCRKNCTGNPRCLKGLGEAAWINVNACSLSAEQQEQKVLKEIEGELRKSGDLVGLRNLGATCYVNTYLQLWFHNVPFRNALYNLHVPEIIEDYPHTLSGQLQLMFGLLQDSICKSVDPTSFINCLGLATDLQQDAQEFSKLLMGVLETNPTLNEVIQDQFCGEYAYLTHCTTCGTVRETPARFYELDLNIQGHKDLKSCINEFLKEENLTGDNQYHCTVCGCKRNAVRKIVLKSLPQTLSLQLLRFVYNRSAQQKQKINTNLSFPDRIDFSPFLQQNGINNANFEYRLSAVLIHRGYSACSGHFVAHILNSANEDWYKFNDEVVVKMNSKKKLDLDNQKGEDNIWDDIISPEKPAAKKLKLSKGVYSSKDVYMLVYTNASAVRSNSTAAMPDHIKRLVDLQNQEFKQKMKEREENAQHQKKTTMENNQNMNLFLQDLQKVCDSYIWLPTDALKSYLNPNKICESLDKKLESFFCSHNKISLDKITSMKYVPKSAGDMVVKRYKMLQCYCNAEMCFECVKQRCLLLQHKRKLNEDSSEIVDLMKQFETANREEGENNNEGYYVGRQSMRKWKRVVLKGILERYQPKTSSPTDEVPINGDGVQSEENGKSETEEFVFNSDLLCEHMNLTTHSNLFQVLPEEVWTILKSYFPDCKTYPVESSGMCHLCMSKVVKEIKETAAKKAMALDQKAKLFQLYHNRNRPTYHSLQDPASYEEVESSQEYYLVDFEFVEDWREFIRSPTKCDPVIDVTNSVFLCQHNLLKYNPIDLLKCKDDYADSPRCVLLKKDEWEYIMSSGFAIDHVISVIKTTTFHCSVVVKKIENSLNLENNKQETVLDDKNTNALKLEPNSNAENLGEENINCVPDKIEKILPELIKTEDEASPSVLIKSNTTLLKSPQPETRKAEVSFSFNPKLCFECMEALKIERHRKLCSYDNAAIFVVKSSKTMEEIKNGGLENGILFNGTNNVEENGGKRRSRSKRCIRGEKKLTGVSSRLTLKELKIKIMSQFAVPPFDQNLWLNGKSLVDDEAQIGSLSIVPGCMILMVEDSPNIGEASVLLDSRKTAEPEAGFKGTGLLGNYV